VGTGPCNTFSPVQVSERPSGYPELCDGSPDLAGSELFGNLHTVIGCKSRIYITLFEQISVYLQHFLHLRLDITVNKVAFFILIPYARICAVCIGHSYKTGLAFIYGLRQSESKAAFTHVG